MARDIAVNVLLDTCALVALAGFFPTFTKYSTLGTFTPLDATVDMHGDVNTAAVTERSLWSDAIFTETTAEVNHYRSDAQPQGTRPMELLPENTLGHFFNRQVRSTTSYQFIETLSGSAQRGDTLHLFKGGIDLLHPNVAGLDMRLKGHAQPRRPRVVGGKTLIENKYAGPLAPVRGGDRIVERDG